MSGVQTPRSKIIVERVQQIDREMSIKDKISLSERILFYEAIRDRIETFTEKTKKKEVISFFCI
jgi:hypothetical protein